MKQCTKCRQRMPLTEFHSNGGGRRRGACKRCEAVRDKARHKPRLRYIELQEEPWSLPEGCLNARKDATKHPLYETWRSMVSRCYFHSSAGYQNYGGRGISVCHEWRHDFWAFRRDMGDKPSPEHSLDRIDNDSDYSPINCRWATRQEQSRNTRLTVRVDFFGETVPLIDLAEAAGLHVQTVKNRIDRGWCLYAALSMPTGIHTKTTPGLLASYEWA